ncbi:hypothetical protein MRX96_048495 [Rhipicephalus microplus]
MFISLSRDSVQTPGERCCSSAGTTEARSGVTGRQRLRWTACAPHIFLSQEFQPNAGVNAASVSVSMAPPHSELDKALQDLVKAQRWKSFTIVYEKPEALLRLRGLLHLTQPGSLPIPVSLRLLPAKMNPGMVLREIAKNGESNIVLDMATHKLGSVVSLLKPSIWMAQDLHSVNLTALQNTGMNLTGFMLLKREVWEQDIGAVREKYTKTGLYPLFLTHRASWKQIRVGAGDYTPESPTDVGLRR